MILPCALLVRCTPFAVTTAAGAAVVGAASQEKGVKGVLRDTSLRTAINYRWIKVDPVLIDRVSLSIHKGRVLLTGFVENPDLKLLAVQSIEDIPGIKVLNAIQVGTPEKLRSYSRDAWITTRLRTALLFDQEVASRNYSVTTAGRIVYLMGTARSQKEIDLIKAHAARVPGVDGIEDYVRLSQKSGLGHS